MSTEKDTKRKNQYNKDNYTSCKIMLRKRESDILANYSQNLGLSKNALLQKCLVYCYEEMIDVSKIELSIADNSEK